MHRHSAGTAESAPAFPSPEYNAACTYTGYMPCCAPRQIDEFNV
jgi:hypothetical protein